MIGQTISHYRILEKLGEGGMGIVYKAEDTKLKRTVALKFLPPELSGGSEANERFIQEARTASALDHPNICTIYEIGETDEGHLFIAMACYEGETLNKRMERGLLPVEETIDIGTQIAQGLMRAHEAGIVHRDIKPSNILVTKDGVAKILDFGLAKVSGRTLLTKSGSTVGTAAYMSPEQARGEQVDRRTDIWSLGATLYEMLSGRRPFEGKYEQALVYAILNHDPRPLRDLRPAVPEAVQRICRRAMAKDPKDRYQTAAELLTDIQSYKAGTRLFQKTRKMPAKRRRLILFGLGALLALAAVVRIVLSPSHTEAIDTIAVLPFVNASGNHEIEYLCDGLTEAVLEDLCRVPGIRKVIAFNSVMQYKTKEIIPRQVAHELGVAGLIISRLYQHGNDVTMSVELIRGQDESRIWGAQYERSLSQLSTVHSEISQTLRENLHLLERTGNTEGVTRQYSRNPEAYRLYLQGEYSFHRITDEGLRKAIEFYRKALLLDPNFALAHAGIANSYAQLIDLNYAPWDDAADSLRLEAANALAIDKNLAEGHLAIALLRYKNYEPEESEREFKQAIALNPLCANAIHWYAHSLSEHGRHDEGIRFMRQSVELEPLSAHYQLCLAFLYLQARRWDEALAENEKIRDIDSTFYFWEYQASLIYFHKGMYDKAIEYATRVASHAKGFEVFAEGVRAWVCAARRDIRGAQRHFRQVYEERQGPRIDPVYVAIIHSRLGNKDSALVWLEKGYRQHSSLFFQANTAPDFDPLRTDPRFVQLMRKAGYTN